MEQKKEIKGTPLCGRCIAHIREHGYTVTEHGRREKITCSYCRKRGYGDICTVTQGEKKGRKAK